VLSRKFRGKFLALLKLQLPNVDQNLLNVCYRREWVVYCKPPFKNAACVVEYLGRYTHRVAISNNRILKLNNDVITFKWRDYRDNSRWKEMTLSAGEFIRRFLMHVLPTGFTKIRHYGFLSGWGKKKKLKACKIQTETSLAPKEKLSAEHSSKNSSAESPLSAHSADIPVCSELDCLRLGPKNCKAFNKVCFWDRLALLYSF
jgi:hypothetical protein